MTQTLNRENEDLYIVDAIVVAERYRTGREDGYRSPSVGEQGRPFINTSRGQVYINVKPGAPAPWIVTWPGGFVEIIDNKRFEQLFDRYEEDEELELDLELIEEDSDDDES